MMVYATSLAKPSCDNCSGSGVARLDRLQPSLKNARQKIPPNSP